MPRTISALVLLLLCSVLSTAAPRPQTGAAQTRDDGSVREIVALERETKDAAMRRDAVFPEHTLSDDYVGIGPLGQISTKEDTINARKTSQLRYDAMEISDMVVRVYGTTAIVTARADVKGKELGQDFSGPYRYTRVWLKHNGRWQVVSYQATITQ